MMGSPQALSEIDRRIVAWWAADCAERVVAIFEAESPNDPRPRDAMGAAIHICNDALRLAVADETSQTP
jgi:hypothetical protein